MKIKQRLDEAIQIVEDEYDDLEDVDSFGDSSEPPPMANELSYEELKVLFSGKITSVEQLGEPWSDDHIYCVAVRVNNIIDFSYWWCGWEFLAAVKYWFDSKQARADAIKMIRDEAKGALQDLEEDPEEYGEE
jgi:hypothetical protein